jgi:hypothetical protein
MNSKLTIARDYLVARCNESSTWRGIILIATAAGAKLKPDQTEAIITAGLMVSGLMGAVTKDSK